MVSPERVRPVVLVTGCSSGIGEAVCRHLCDAGWKVYGASRSPCGAAGVTYLPLDVTEAGSVAAAVAHLVEREGRIDALVAAAGRSLTGPVEETTIEAAQAVFDVNFFGAVRCVDAVVPAMRARGTGKIILIGSIAGTIGLPFLGFYSATKFALNGLAEALRLEAAPFGVQVCVVEPGDFRTNISANEHHTGTTEASPYWSVYRRIRQLYGARVEAAPPPTAVAQAVRALLDRGRMPLRRRVGSQEERLGAVSKPLVGASLFERILKRNLRL